MKAGFSCKEMNDGRIHFLSTAVIIKFPDGKLSLRQK